MNFTNLVELVQVFANEYCYPSSVILVYGNIEEIELIKEQFKFITSEVISMDTSHGKNIDIVVSGELLPFESHSFDLILSFKNIHGDFKRVLKPNGKLLTTGVIIDALDTYYYDNKVFSVI
jgi:hypothetical protein